MSQQGKRAALGITVGIVLAVVALGFGWRALQSRTPMDAAMESEIPVDASSQGRTPIDIASLGPQVGEPVPSFSLPDQNGRVRTLESILGRNGAMLLFYRSADW